MSTWLKITLFLLLAAFIVIQFFQPDRSIPKAQGELQAPPKVMSVLETSCYDCHSNQTDWPWYSYVNPAGWLVEYDVSHGREHFSFSDWRDYSDQKQYSLKQEILEVVESSEMPLSRYLWMHDEAELSPEDYIVIKKWVASGDNGR